MTHDEQIRHDLDYISAAVRRQEQPVGTPASVAATVSCTVELSELALPGLPDRVVSATVTSPLDVFRGR